MKKLIVIFAIVLNTINLFSSERTLKFEGRESRFMYEYLVSSNNTIMMSVENLKERHFSASYFLGRTIYKYFSLDWKADYYKSVNKIKEAVRNSEYSKDIKEYEIDDYIFARFNFLFNGGFTNEIEEIYITLENKRITKVTCKFTDSWINIAPRRMFQINSNAEYYKLVDKEWNELDITIINYLNSDKQFKFK